MNLYGDRQMLVYIYIYIYFQLIGWWGGIYWEEILDLIGTCVVWFKNWISWEREDLRRGLYTIKVVKHRDFAILEY